MSQTVNNTRCSLGCCSSTKVTNCGSYVLLCPREGCRDNLLYFSTLPSDVHSKLDLTCIIDKFEADYEVRLDGFGAILIKLNWNCCNFDAAFVLASLEVQVFLIARL